MRTGVSLGAGAARVAAGAGSNRGGGGRRSRSVSWAMERARATLQVSVSAYPRCLPDFCATGCRGVDAGAVEARAAEGAARSDPSGASVLFDAVGAAQGCVSEANERG